MQGLIVLAVITVAVWLLHRHAATRGRYYQIGPVWPGRVISRWMRSAEHVTDRGYETDHDLWMRTTRARGSGVRWRCSCGYGAECAVHCGNGHRTGACPVTLEAEAVITLPPRVKRAEWEAMVRLGDEETND